MSVFHLVAPSGYCVNQDAATRAVARLQQAVRGGYGASRLLARIDWQGLAHRQRHQPLLICGHSDFTAIQLGLLAIGNAMTFSGPMLVGNLGAETLDSFTEEHFWRALCNKTFSLQWQGEGPACAVEGTLWGGNLAMLVSLIGLPFGHEPRTVTLPPGAKAALSHAGSHYQLSICDHPVLNE